MVERKKLTNNLLQSVGILEEPFGVYYANTLPAGAFGPKEGPEISRELEEQGAIDFAKVFQNFSCIMANIWLARKKKSAAYISRKEYGCPGGVYYAGFCEKHVRFIENYVSTGMPGTPMHGERYIRSPKEMCQFLEDLSPPPAPATYGIFKPLSNFTETELPEAVIFFARPEALVGLQTLAYFTTGDYNVVATHFGSACSHISSWPRAYTARGIERAILGGCDPTARKFMNTDEMLLTIPLGLYDKMLKAMPESVLETHTWKNVLKKVEKSNRTWSKT